MFDGMDAQEKIRIDDKGAAVKKDVNDFAEAITLRVAAETLAIPLSPELTAEQIRAVAGAIRGFYG